LKYILNFILGLLSYFAYIIGIVIIAVSYYSPLQKSTLSKFTGCGLRSVWDVSDGCLILHALLLGLYTFVNYIPVFIIVCIPIVLLQRLINAPNYIRRLYLIGFVLSSMMAITMSDTYNPFDSLSSAFFALVPILTFISAYLLVFLIVKRALNKHKKAGVS